MRVISGTAKGRQLQSVPGDLTRPITDRAKEALFDIIGPDVQASRWWDVFAGTGSVGIEALSRGAAFAWLTDLNRLPIDTIRSNLARTRLADRAEVSRGDAFTLIAASPVHKFDYVYLAPPQRKGLWDRAVVALGDNSGWLSDDAWVIAQIDTGEYLPLGVPNLVEFDQRRYGTTLLVFYTPPQERVL
jgi:16S rRNA (guanine(966)-N(2))-methyltransferase RsmD